MYLELWGYDIGPEALANMFAEHLVWNIFLTSTALHAVALITSPLQAVYKWYRRQSSDGDVCLPYVCALVGSSLWLRYALFLEDPKLALLQMYAVSMQSFFLLLFVYYRTKKKRLVRNLLIGGTVLLLIFYYTQILDYDEAKQFAGRMASGAQIAGSFVCPYLIYKAVTSGCIDFIPMAPVLFTWIMEIHAIIYSVGIDDFYMMIANTTFFLMDGSLLAMFFILPTEKPEAEKPKEVIC
ncbi:unnamed protein product, partial [Mesorhabditis spiculigera]